MESYKLVLHCKECGKKLLQPLTTEQDGFDTKEHAGKIIGGGYIDLKHNCTVLLCLDCSDDLEVIKKYRKEVIQHEMAKIKTNIEGCKKERERVCKEIDSDIEEFIKELMTLKMELVKLGVME